MKRDLFEAAMARDPNALGALARALSPVIRNRVARALARGGSRRAVGSVAMGDYEDLVQEVFVALFERDARALRAWDETRGASLTTFVGIVAEHRIASILRSGRRRRCLPSFGDDAGEAPLENAPDPSAPPDSRAAARQLGSRLVARMREELSPRSFDLFLALFVDQRPVDDVCAAWGMTARAVWARRCRLKKQIRKVVTELEPRDAARRYGSHRKPTRKPPRTKWADGRPPLSK